MAEEAKAHLGREVAELEARLPVDVLERPIAELVPAEALGRAALAGLHQLIRIIEQPLDLEDLKQQRLIGDMSVAAGKLLMRASEGEFKARRENVVAQLLEALRAQSSDAK